MKDKNFKFWVPLEFSKAKDAEGNEVMKMGGIASTIDEDSDGEQLDPAGFDLSIFKSKGLINWHHQSKNNPDAIIGEPTKAEIRKDGLYIETELYQDSELAKKVYKLAEVLQKGSKTRRLGFSIEGKAVARDILDKKKITKANITGCAITFMPKNGSTFANILKGEGCEEEEFDEPSEVEKSDEFKALVAPTIANGGSTKYLVDITTEDGKKVKVTKSGEVSIDFSKSISTEPGKGGELKKEHVDGDLKDIAKSAEESKELTKGEVFDKIFSDMPDINVSKAKQIFNLITKISQMKNKETAAAKTAPTQEDIQKAYEMLGLSGEDNSSDDLTKGEDEEKEAEPEKEVEAPKTAEKEIEKAAEPEEEEEETEEEEEESDSKTDLTKSETSFSYLKKGDNTYARMINKGGELEELAGRNFMKNGDGQFVEIIKSPIEKALEDTISKMSEKQDELSKAMSTVIGDLSSKVASLQGTLDQISSGVPGRKSADSTKVKERKFAGAEEIAKAKGDGKLLSIKDRQGMLSILEKATFSDINNGKSNEIDTFFEKALTVFEASGHLSEAAQNRLAKDFSVLITD